MPSAASVRPPRWTTPRGIRNLTRLTVTALVVAAGLGGLVAGSAPGWSEGPPATASGTALPDTADRAAAAIRTLAADHTGDAVLFGATDDTVRLATGDDTARFATGEAVRFAATGPVGDAADRGTGDARPDGATARILAAGPHRGVGPGQRSATGGPAPQEGAAPAAPSTGVPGRRGPPAA